MDDFKSTLDDEIHRLKSTPKAEGAERVYVAGEKEFEKEKENSVKGVIVDPPVFDDLKAIADELNLEFDL